MGSGTEMLAVSWARHPLLLAKASYEVGYSITSHLGWAFNFLRPQFPLLGYHKHQGGKGGHSLFQPIFVMIFF